MRGSLWQPPVQASPADSAELNDLGLWQPPGTAAASVTKSIMMPSKTRSKLKAEIDQLKGELAHVRTRLAETEESQKAFSEQIKELQAQLASKNVQPKPLEAIPKAPARPSPALPAPAPAPPVPAQQPAALAAVAHSCAKKRKRDMEFRSLDWDKIAMPADHARDGERSPVAYDADLVESAPVPGLCASQDHFLKEEPLDWSRITAFATSRIFHGIPFATTYDIVYKLRQGELNCVNMIQIRPMINDVDENKAIHRSRYDSPLDNLEMIFSTFWLMYSEHVTLAASITMIGVPLPNEQACERCQNLGGPFQFCTVLRGHGKGSCNNCIHDEEGNYCTFRDGTPETSLTNRESK